jgi:hypothetical protein
MDSESRFSSTPTSPESERLPALITRFQADYGALDRLHTAPFSPRRRDALCALLAQWEAHLEEMPFESLARSDQLDWLLLKNFLLNLRDHLAREERQWEEMEPLLPSALPLIALEEDRRQLKDVDGREAAERLDQARQSLEATRRTLETDPPKTRPAVAYRAAKSLEAILAMLECWHGFYYGYDPLFTWWTERPYQSLKTAAQAYGAFLREKIAHAEDAEAIIGDPIGRDDLLQELQRALIPYSPEELMAIARQEEEWCLKELRRAARKMGCGDNWRRALEMVKERHEPPGGQPRLIRELAQEAIRYVEGRDLVTVPPLAREGWRMEMMSAERQKVNPFFLGGETIVVSYPTAEMEHEQKRMSLRGNNRHFARATVHHELIPGHYLQSFSQERYRPYRRLFYTPFWTEGWTLHWEMLLWETGFAQSPEDQIGMLFWRLHRCARVQFSLGFHLGQMTPQECVEMLVNAVGHERENALGEVRRSFEGDYDPLYQCAYLIGGLQMHALYREMTASGRQTDRQFHDAVMQENCMPIPLLRTLLTGSPFTRDLTAEWRFYPLPPPNRRLASRSSSHFRV